MAEIAAMTERIVRKAKEYDRDTIPGDYATLTTPCPNCGGVVKENYRRFTCTGKAGARARAAASRSARSRAGAASSSTRSKQFLAQQEDRPAGGLPLQGGLAVHRRAEAGLRRRDQELEARVRLRRRRQEGRGRRRAGRLLGAGERSAPARSARATSTSTARSYVCEHAVGAPVTCDFKSGKIILQQPVAREQMTQAAGHRQDRPAGELRLQQDAAQVQGRLACDKKEGKVSFEFEPRGGARRRRRRRRPRRRPDAGVADELPSCLTRHGERAVAGRQRGAQRQAHRRRRPARRRLARAPGRAAGGRQGQRRAGAWVADELDLPRRAVPLVRGQTARRKWLEIDGSQEEVMRAWLDTSARPHHLA